MGIPERLVEIREAHGYTRRRLCNELGKPYATVTKYETGEREPGHTYIIEIAEKFGVTTDYILGVQNQKTSPSMATATPEEDKLIGLYRELNEEGQEKLVDYAEDLVIGGRYIKSDETVVGKEA